jgi:hypothetical protein
MGFPYKENRTDQSRRIEQGGPTCPVHESCIVKIRTMNICVARKGYFLLLRKKKFWCINASVRNHWEAYVRCREVTSLVPVHGIIRDAIWDWNYLPCMKRLHRAQLHLPSLLSRKSKGVRQCYVTNRSQNIWCVMLAQWITWTVEAYNVTKSNLRRTVVSLGPFLSYFSAVHTIFM